MPKQELILNTTFHIILEAYLYTKKHAELRYCEFDTEIQNGARKAAMEAFIYIYIYSNIYGNTICNYKYSFHVPKAQKKRLSQRMNIP